LTDMLDEMAVKTAKNPANWFGRSDEIHQHQIDITAFARS